jgi:hypothetical protein
MMTLRHIDGLSRDGASELAHMIEKFWRDKGWLVKCEVERFSINPSKSKKKPHPMVIGADTDDEVTVAAETKLRESTSNCWCVRSNMVNGWPRYRLPEMR